MQDLFQFSPAFLGIVPVVLGLVQIVKQLGMKSKWSPLVAIGLSIAGLFLVGVEWREALLSGVFVGLSASGLWSGTKSVAGY